MDFGQTQDQMPQDDTMMQLELQRKLKLADALCQQATPEGQMVSGHYVAPSWTQQLANLYGKYQAGQGEKEAIKQYGDYLGQQKKTRQTALASAIKKLGPQDITEQSTYDIQVPNNQTAGPTDNLGAMQPYESGKKTISVPMTKVTGTRQPSYEDALAALGEYANSTNQPDLAEKLLMNKATSLMTPDKFNLHNIGDTAYLISERTGKPMLDANGQPIKYEGQQKLPDYGTAANSSARALFGKDFKDLSQSEQLKVTDYVNKFKAGNLDVARGNLGVNQQQANFNTGGPITNQPQAKTTSVAEVQDYAKKHGISYEAASNHANSLGYTVQ